MTRWKVVNYNTNYEISDDGRLRRGDKILRLGLAGGGSHYPYYPMMVGGAKRGYYIHNLVLEAFVGPRPDGMQCNHKDGNKLNNHVDNLEWVTHKNNMIHAARNHLLKPSKRNGCQHPLARCTEDEIKGIRWWRKHGLSLKEISGIFRMSETNVSYIVRYIAYPNVGEYSA